MNTLVQVTWDQKTGMSLLCLCWFSANGVCIMIKHLITAWVWVHVLLREETFSCLHQKERRPLPSSSSVPWVVGSSLRSTARHQREVNERWHIMEVRHHVDGWSGWQGHWQAGIFLKAGHILADSSFSQWILKHRNLLCCEAICLAM